MEERKKRKSYFSNQGKEQKRRKGLSLECGMQGFFCTCNFREKDCVREAYNLLNEYADKIYGPDEKDPHSQKIKVKSQDNKETNEKGGDEKQDLAVEISNMEQCKNDDSINGNKIETVEDDKKKEGSKDDIKKEESKDDVNDDEESEKEDISDALNKEITELAAEARKPLSEKRFQVVDTGVNNVIFIKSTVPDTLKLVTAIIEDIQETKKQKSRYLLRMLPVQVTCKAYIDDIKTKANVLFEPYFSQEPKTYSIVFNRHSNSNLQRNEVIEDLAQIIAKKKSWQ